MSTAAPGETPAVATTCPQSREKLSALKQALRALGFNRLVHTHSLKQASKNLRPIRKSRHTNKLVYAFEV